MDSNSKSVRKRKDETEVKKQKDEITDRVSVRPGELPVKLFEDRKSVLTDLLENTQFASVHHICIALFVGACISSIVHDYLYNGKVRMGLNLVLKGFRNMHLMIMIWLLVFLLSCVPYFGVKYWAQVRSSLKRKSLQMYFWDRISLFLYIAHLFGMLYCGSSLLLKNEMGFTAGLSSIVETVRLMMKVYSFGRVCISRVLNEPEKYSKQHPTFSHYIYFFFAPTLLYKDSYPRSCEKIRWGKVALYFSELIGVIFFCSITFDRAFIAEFKDYGIKHISVIDIMLTITNNAPYGMLFMFSLNYLLLHLWLNAFAEMLSFSDRLFYKDWWTSATYERYYRTWNTVVHDWLYAYVYKDLFEIVLPKRKMVGKVAVFLLSSVFHDFVVSLAIGFFLPVFLIYFFVLGEMIAYVKFPNNFIGNVFLLYTLGLGCSTMLTAYTLEHFSRVNCVTDNSSLLDFFIPKFIECYK